MNRIRKKSIVGIIAGIVAAAVLVTTLSTGIYFVNKESRANRLTVENIYQENLYSLSENMSNIELNMSKLVISTSNIETALLLNDTYHHSMAAARCVGTLPLDPVEAEVTDRFLNQLGDWCMTLSRRFMQGEGDAGGLNEGDAVVAGMTAADLNSLNSIKSNDKVVNNLSINSDSYDTVLDKTSINSAVFPDIYSVDSFSARAIEVDAVPAEVTDDEGDKAVINSENKDIKTNKNAGTPNSADEDNAGKTDGLESFDEQCEEFLMRAKRLNSAVRDAAESLGGRSRILSRAGVGMGHLGDLHLDGLGLVRNNLGGNLGSGNNGTGSLSANISDSTVKSDEFDLPEIIYDGPFSDGQNQKSFKCLDGKEILSETAAIEKAQTTFQLLGLRNLKKVGETSTPRAFIFRGDTNKKEMYVCVSENGGMIISASLPCDNSGKTDRLTQDEATEKAKNYAKMCGFGELKSVWYTAAAGFATVNLTPEVDGVIYYPDLVKVKVCLVSGDFAGIEALGYCSCNHSRDLSATISAKEAQRAVSPKLEISGTRLAIIPKNGKEFLCYEFSGEFRGMDYLVYIDATTGKQINIMRVMEGEQGKIVM